ncbi:MAG TPA: hypothetical protein DFS52_29915 [Myxococcales bacterium]|nr:hypothetical protein [Myxococcales bacterium]
MAHLRESSLTLALVVALTAVGCPRCSAPQLTAAPPHVPRVPDGYGEAGFSGEILRVRARKLLLPDGRACGAEAPECAEGLAALRGKQLGGELEGSLLMADLSEPLAALALALEPKAQACLLVGDSASVRCLPFRPFSGGQFAAWLDAPEPVGKVRVVMHSDGIEVVADRGKVPGPDRYGLSLPPLRGKPDLKGLEPLMRRMAYSFPSEDEAGVVPSGRMTVEEVARALACLSGPDAERFSETFLVYP